MERDPGSVIDRYAIAKLKHKHGISGGVSLDVYKHALTGLQERFPNIPWHLLLDMSLVLNSLIWTAEEKIRGGDLDGDLEAVGRAAILTRNTNAARVLLGNLINKLAGYEAIEQKIDHVSMMESTEE